MGFDVVEILRDTTGTGAGCPHQFRLRMTSGCCDVTPLRQPDAPIGGAGSIDGRCLNDGVDRIPVALGRRQRFDGEDERTFRAHVAVGFRVEGMALSIRADDAQGVEGSA